MCILQVPQLHYFIKRQKTPAGQTLFKTLSLHIYSGGKFYLDRHMRKKTKRTKAFFKGYIYTQVIFTIFTINAPKWRQSAANCGNMATFEPCNVFELGCAFR